jgi:hypothetical protein
MATADISGGERDPAPSERRQPLSDAARRVTDLLSEHGERLTYVAALIGRNQALSDSYPPSSPVTAAFAQTASESWSAVRSAVRAYGAHLMAAGVRPEALVLAARALVGGRRVHDLNPGSARLAADIVTWTIQGYYGTDDPSP